MCIFNNIFIFKQAREIEKALTVCLLGNDSPDLWLNKGLIFIFSYGRLRLIIFLKMVTIIKDSKGLIIVDSNKLFLVINR